jgi:hypothetical protein
MKIKALRKIDTKEFVEISNVLGADMLFTSDLPKPMAETATMDDLKPIYSSLYPTIDMDDIELVEFDLIEAGVVGADIRNKLTPLLNLISLVKIHLGECNEEKKLIIRSLIKDEMKISLKNIKYLSNML